MSRATQILVGPVLERLLGKAAYLHVISRIPGAVLLALGVSLTKSGVIDTLQEAERHEVDSVSTSSAVAMIPVFLILGTVSLLGGSRIVGWGKRLGLTPRPDGSRSVGGWTLMGLILAPGFVLYFWLQQRLRDLGYGR